MQNHKLATVINFCTNESRFLKPCIEEALTFSSQVIIPVCDHFFDGAKENQSLLEQIYAAFPQCLFIEYPFIVDQIPKRIFASIDRNHFWHSLSRLIAVMHLDEEIERILFLDADEIPDGGRFNQWLQWGHHATHTTLKFANYWYFREPRFRASQWEDSIVLAHRRSLEPSFLLDAEEREAIYHSLPGPKRRQVVGVDGQPMFHHFSWVRTQEEMLKKVRAWGHREDRDWEELVRQEFAEPFQGKDFVHGYPFSTVEPIFPISFETPVFPARGKPNVKRLKPREVLSTVNKGRGSFWSALSSFFSRSNHY